MTTKAIENALSQFKALHESTLQGTYQVIESNVLPIPGTCQACDIETRLEITVPSGEWIHIFELERPSRRLLGDSPMLPNLSQKLLLVSPEVMKELKKLPTA